jgi:hypothetical protein
MPTSTSLSALVAHLNGKPYFQQGPYDNPTRIMRTLDRTVGPGNYHFSTVMTDPDL